MEAPVEWEVFRTAQYLDDLAACDRASARDADEELEFCLSRKPWKVTRTEEYLPENDPTRFTTYTVREDGIFYIVGVFLDERTRTVHLQYILPWEIDKNT